VVEAYGGAEEELEEEVDVAGVEDGGASKPPARLAAFMSK